MLQKVIERSHLIKENKELKAQLQDAVSFTNIVYGSPKMEGSHGVGGTVASSQATILIRGESGTGKELIANAIHYASPRSEKPWVKVSCAAIPETLLESELFGHEKGAFTGPSRKDWAGLKKRTEGPSFSMKWRPHSGIQVKLLRILQDKEFQRLGSNVPLKADVRVITATHRI